MKIFLLRTSLLIGLVALGCEKSAPDNSGADSSNYYTEAHRPQIHFSPESNWMNDPNGMVYYDGEYHLFYQYYPDSTVWGPMHWGHAISTDMVTWEHLPIALYPDKLGYIFSGSAVIDWNNTSGLQEGEHPPMVAIFTHHLMEGEKAGRNDFQAQSIAYSHDKGRTWQMYEGNPVIPNPGIKDFRDPKVFWHEADKKWTMIFAAGDRVKLYSSPDLKTWEFLSDFGMTYGGHGGVWECPDLFPLVLEGSDETKWVMLVSINPGGPNGGSATQYFIGDFDGKTFTPDQAEDDIKWLDYGRDNYAGVTWSDVPETDGRRLFIGWMSNWDYAQVVPTEKWRSATTVPRSLHLVQRSGELIVSSRPVTELQNIHARAINFGEATIDEEALFMINVKGDSSAPVLPPFRTEILFDHTNSTSSEYGIILQNAKGELYRLYISDGHLWSDRTNAGDKSFEKRFAQGVHKGGPVMADERGLIRLEVIFDTSSAEIFVNNGEVVMTDLFFPNELFNQAYIYALDGTVQFEGFKTTALKSIWRK